MLVLENIWYKDIIRNVSLTHSKGILAIIGPNGAGKTTLLKIIAGSIKPDKGVVKTPKRIGASWQNPYYSFYRSTVREEVELAYKIAGKKGDPLELLRAYGLERLADKSPYRISMGEARLLSIALTLVWDPDLVLLDEPTTGLDYFEKGKLASILWGLGKPVIIASHDLDFILRVSDYVAVMHKGEILVYDHVFNVFYSRILEKIGFPLPPAVLVGEALGRRIRCAEECLS